MGGSRLGQWLRKHEVANWLGVALGLISIALTPVFGWVTPVGIILLVSGGLLVGVLLTSYLMAPPRHQLKCISCVTTHMLSGLRGAHAIRTEVMRFKAQADLTAFIYAITKRAGSVQNEIIRFRNLGPAGGTSAAWFGLGKNHLLVASSPDGASTYTVQPPMPIKKGDIFEVSTELTTAGSYNNDDEYVGKNLIYPTQRLSLIVDFDGCGVTNCMGTKFELRLISGSPLAPTADGVKSKVEWTLENCKAGQSYRIEWKWAA